MAFEVSFKVSGQEVNVDQIDDILSQAMHRAILLQIEDAIVPIISEDSQLKVLAEITEGEQLKLNLIGTDQSLIEKAKSRLDSKMAKFQHTN